jgi:hypothetical protein
MRGSVYIVDIQLLNLINLSSVRTLKLYRECAREDEGKRKSQRPFYDMIPNLQCETTFKEKLMLRIEELFVLILRHVFAHLF